MNLKCLVLCLAHLCMNSFYSYLEKTYYVWGPVLHPGYTIVDTTELALNTELKKSFV